MSNQSTDEQLNQTETADREAILADLRWYGHEIAGGGPMIGYAHVAMSAERHWYAVTLPLLQRLNAVYSNPRLARSKEQQ